MLKNIENGNFAKILEDFLNKYSNEEKIKKSEELSDLVIETIKDKNLYHAGQLFIDTMVASSYLHNVFYDENNWVSLYNLRKILNEENVFPKEIRDTICSTVEAQLGAQSPVESSAPKTGTPTEIFSNCVFYYKLGARAKNVE